MSASVSTSKISTAEKSESKKRVITCHLKKGIFIQPLKSESSPIKKSKPMSSSFASHFGSPWKTKLVHVDSMVLHNSKVEKALLSPEKLRKTALSARDPILQNNGEPTQQPVPCCKIDAKSHKTTIFSNDESDHIQLFNNKTRPTTAPKSQLFQEIETKAVGIKVNSQPRRNPIVSEPEERRVRSPQPARSYFNPITEGDPEGVVNVKPRIYENLNSDTKRINDRKAFLSAERTLSPTKGRLFRESNIFFSTEPDTNVALPRALSPAEKKVRGTMDSVIQYHGNQNYRDLGVSGKCTQANAETVIKATVENDRTFSRKKVTH
jgi:hypothetical protein